MKKKKKKFSVRIFRENLELGILALPVFILLGVFAYWPMFGIVLAFKNYKVTKGIFGSDWVDPLFKNFDFFLKSKDAPRIIRNTLGLNLLFIVAGIFFSVVFALLLYEVKKAYQIKIYQTFAILPSFLSWVAVSYIVYALLEPSKGIINQIVVSFGGDKISWYTEASYWPIILVIVRIWHSVGLSCIVYYAALMGIDSELYEAAEVDGATKFQRVIHISIPHLVPIIIIMGILDVGKIFRSDFGMFYNVTRNMPELYATTDVMDTYVYRALMVGNLSMSSASSVIQSIVCCITLVVTNAIVKKISPENSLF